MDVMVLATQQWLNNTYGNDTRFNVVPEDGITGWHFAYTAEAYSAASTAPNYWTGWGAISLPVWRRLKYI
jgi:hypothetical protein